MSDVTLVGSFLSSTIFQTRPLVDLKFGRVQALRGHAAPAGVNDIYDWFLAGSLVVCHILNTDELEYIVDVAPVLEHPLRTINTNA